MGGSEGASAPESLEIKPVRWIDEVLDVALERPIAPLVRPEGENVRPREERKDERPVESPVRPH